MKRKLPLLLLCLFFAGICAYYGLTLYGHWREYNAGAEVYRELAQYAPPQTEPEGIPLSQTPEPNETAPAEVPDDTNWPTVDFASLQAINPDIVAWIVIEGTNINYPVVQGQDNNGYLDRLFDGTKNGAGSIFMDYRNPKDLSGRNTVLYGHNLKDGTMFHQITQYKDQDFYEQHPTALLITPEGNYKIAFVAGYVTDMNSDAWKLEFASDEEFHRWAQKALAQSDFTGAAQLTPQDRVVTLSTCTYDYTDARYVLVGILK